MTSTAIVIPTFNRERVFIETLTGCLALTPAPDRLIVVDQTGQHQDGTQRQLCEWADGGKITWLRLSAPSVTRAMNAGILAADQTDVVLFLDDDVTPERGLVGAHAAAYAAHPDAWAVAGQVLQPGEEAADCSYRGSARGLLADLDFPFRSTHGSWVHNAMAGNLSVRRNKALQVGGFDENFVPPVAYRFETEFARRIERGGGKIWFEPRATLRHMRAADGGTRTAGGHLASASPSHGVGDYYYALVCGHGAERFLYWLRRPFREVMTRFHLCRPWWIPVKFVGELRAMAMALRLYRNGPRRLDAQKVKA